MRACSGPFAQSMRWERTCKALKTHYFLSYTFLSFSEESVKLVFCQKREELHPEGQMVGCCLIGKRRRSFPNQLRSKNQCYHSIYDRRQYKWTHPPTTSFEFNFPFNTHRQYVFAFPLNNFFFFIFALGWKKIPENPKYLGKKKTQQEAI